MEIIGFVLCAAILAYWFCASVVGVCMVNFAIQMGGGKDWQYIFPFASLVLNVYLWSVLLQHSPFTVTVS